MDKSQIQACISECESALSHLKLAMDHLDNGQSRDKMQHAQQDLEACISECQNML
jgi:hypothetical protein